MTTDYENYGSGSKIIVIDPYPVERFPVKVTKYKQGNPVSVEWIDQEVQPFTNFSSRAKKYETRNCLACNKEFVTCSVAVRCRPCQRLVENARMRANRAKYGKHRSNESKGIVK